MKTTLLVLLMLIGMHTFCQTNFYISPTGNDNQPGTQSQPWQTVQHAMDNATPGSTIHIMAGTYNEKVYVNVSGTAGNLITFKNYNNDEVIIDGTGWNDPAICEIYDVQYVRLEGLHFKNNVQLDAIGILIEGQCSNIQIVECKISEIHFSADSAAPVNENTNAQPLIVYGPDPGFAITDLIILDNEIYNARIGYSEGLAVNGNVDGFEISGNYVHDITNIGIDVIGHEGTCSDPAVDQARNGYIDWNTVYNCQSGYASAAGIYVDGGKDLYIENNIVYNNQWGIEVGCENLDKTTSGIVVRNNFVYGNSSGGIQLGGYDYPDGSGKVTDCMVVNNSLFSNSTINYYDGELTLTYSENCTIVNNIFYANNPEAQLISLEDVLTIPPGLVLDHNLWYHPVGADNSYIYWCGTDYESFSDFVSATGFEANALFIDPDFESIETNNPDLHLKQSSIAIGAANTSWLSNAGSKDIDDEDRVHEGLELGADEYYASSGIFDRKGNTILKVYPNPATDFVFIDLPENTKADMSISVFNLQGVMVKQIETAGHSRLNLRGLSTGLYSIIAVVDATSWGGKVLVK